MGAARPRHRAGQLGRLGGRRTRLLPVLRCPLPARTARVTSPLALAGALYLARVDETPGREERALAGMIRVLVERRVDGAIARRFDPRTVALVRRTVFEPVDTALAPHAVAQAVEEALSGPLHIARWSRRVPRPE